MGLKHYVTADVIAAVMILICNYLMKWDNHGSDALMWSKWDVSNRYRIIIAKIERFIFERIETIRSLGPAVI